MTRIQVIEWLQRLLIVIVTIFIVFFALFLYLRANPSLLHNPTLVVTSLPIALSVVIGAGTIIGRALSAIIEAHKHWLTLQHKIRELTYSEQDRTRIQENGAIFSDQKNSPRYVERQEWAVLRALKKHKNPSIVDIVGPRGAGKARMLRFLIRLRLIDHYRGRVVYVDVGRSSPATIGHEIVSSLATVVNKEDDSIDMTSDATQLNDVQIYFRDHPKESWLIVIIADALPPLDLLAKMIGLHNTIVISHIMPLTAAQKHDLQAQFVIKKTRIQKAIAIPPFKKRPAWRLFDATLKGVYIHPRDRVLLASLLDGTYPAVITAFATAYKKRRSEWNSIRVQGEREPILSAGDVSAFAELILTTITGIDQQIALAALGIFSAPTPEHLAPIALSPALVNVLYLPDNMFDARLEQGYDGLAITNAAAHAQFAVAMHRCARQRYISIGWLRRRAKLTIFGLNMAQYIVQQYQDTTIANTKRRLIAYYRQMILDAKANKAGQSELGSELRHILDVWSYVGLNSGDTVLFAHALRAFLVNSPERERGYRLLEAALAVAQHDNHAQAQYADLALAAAQLAQKLQKSDDAKRFAHMALAAYSAAHNDEGIAEAEHILALLET